MRTYTITLEDADDLKLREVYADPMEGIKSFLCGSIDNKKSRDAALSAQLTDPATIVVTES